MEVRKHNARKITETFDYGRDEQAVSQFSIGYNKIPLKGFNIAGERGKISLTFDERDKQQVVDLLRSMADSLDGKIAPRGNTEKGQRAMKNFAQHLKEAAESTGLKDVEVTFIDSKDKEDEA